MNARPEIHHSQPAGPAILHPTDFAPGGASALAHAVAISLKTHARLTLLHVRDADAPGPTRHGLTPVADLLVGWRRLTPQARFADLPSRLGFSAVCLDVPARSVSAGVLAHFEDHPVELAALTTRATSGLSYWFAGSVSRRALRRADSMILFLREGQRGFVDPRSGEIGLKRALIPIDSRIPWERALPRALRLIDGLGVSVEKRLLHIGTERPPGCPNDIPLKLAQGPVVETILAAAQEFRADLIVMPTGGKRGLLAAFRNSVSARILEDARWPVLSAPAT